MKKIIATSIMMFTINMMTVQANGAKVLTTLTVDLKHNPLTAEQIATRESERMQKTLGLSDEQKKQVYKAALSHANSVKIVRSKYQNNPDKMALRAELKPINQQYKESINSILTDEQKAKWEQERLKRKEIREQQHFNHKNGPEPQGPPSENTQLK